MPKAPLPWSDEDKLRVLFQIAETSGIKWDELDLPEGRDRKAVTNMLYREKQALGITPKKPASTSKKGAVVKSEASGDKDEALEETPTKPKKPRAPRKPKVKEYDEDGNEIVPPKRKRAPPKKKAAAKADDETDDMITSSPTKKVKTEDSDASIKSEEINQEFGLKDEEATLEEEVEDQEEGPSGFTAINH